MKDSRTSCTLNFIALTSATITSKHVSDGQWHIFKWNRYSSVFQLYLDNKYQTEFVASGNGASLNFQVDGKVPVIIGSSGMITIAIP